MELPKNVTQIGEPDRSCRVYVEDYVMSYLKQINQAARSKDLAVALYGVRKEEGEVAYLFLYGACRLTSLQREIRHLSQAQQQEIEKARQRYFPEYDFQGYRLLNGDMIEGFHVCERGICRYIAGYAQFYEKNDSMLSFMLETRGQDIQPEVVDREKYESARRRQEERKAQAQAQSERKAPPVQQEDKPALPRAAAPAEKEVLQDGLTLSERQALSRTWKTEQKRKPGVRQMRVAAVGVFALLCVLGLASMNDGRGIADIQVWARQALASFTEQKLPDDNPQGSVEVMGPAAGSDTLIAEDRLTDAVLQENGQASQEPSAPETSAQPSQEPPAVPTDTNPTQPSEQQPQAPPVESTAPAEGPALVSYVIRQGDTLTNICLRNYGSNDRVQEVCSINGIADPDDIKVGQEILLPQ